MRKAKLFMDTVVDIQVVAEGPADAEAVDAQIERAFSAFRSVEQACSRFSADSELMRACRAASAGQPVQVSPLLFEPLKFALEMSRWTGGLFDPTVGRKLEQHGFNRHYLTGEIMDSSAEDEASFRDIELDHRERSLALSKPLVIDLGAVAKGFAIDLAAQELRGFAGFLVNAGGDLYAGGTDARGERWRIGIQHPHQADRIIDSVEIADAAVCTSGSYERKSKSVPGMHHILHPKTGQSPNELVSCSVIAPFAMLADAASTAAFLMGEADGRRFLEQLELQGILITSEGLIKRTEGMQ